MIIGFCFVTVQSLVWVGCSKNIWFGLVAVHTFSLVWLQYIHLVWFGCSTHIWFGLVTVQIFGMVCLQYKYLVQFGCSTHIWYGLVAVHIFGLVWLQYISPTVMSGILLAFFGKMIFGTLTYEVGTIIVKLDMVIQRQMHKCRVKPEIGAVEGFCLDRQPQQI